MDLLDDYWNEDVDDQDEKSEASVHKDEKVIMTGEGDDNKPAKVQREDDNDRREAIKARAIICAQQDTLSRAQAGNATAMLPSNQGSKAAFAPKDVLALAVSPALAQSQVPLYGPLRPDQRKAGGLYRNFRNYEMGQLTETTKEDALALAEKYGLNDAALRARQDREILKRARERTAEEERLAAEKGVELPKLSGKRAKNDDPASEEYLGPWAPYENELQRREVLRVISGGEDGANIVISGTSEKQAGAQDEEGTSEAPEKSTVTFHGKNAPEDWLRPSKTLPKAPEEGTFQLPKRSTFTFKGHTKGVNRIRWFPKSAHMLLSASMDGTCKIWSTGSSKHCIATYTAHTKAVKDVNFTADGRHFYSASFDTTVKMWDTEYGKVVTSFGNGKFPHCVTVHPDESMQNVVICGCQNKKAIQFDSKTGQIVQEYDEHLAAVNTVTFCENNKKIVTTSDDKKLFIWEVGIGVVVKHIAEPYMHAMPAVTLDPQGKFLACQSMDNQIVVYEGSGRFRLQSRRRFRGHPNTGYAISPGFSPDAAFLTSGDSSGKVWFWDWKTTKVYRTLQAHDGVCMQSIWNPLHTSQIATCGWDGLVKLWE